MKQRIQLLLEECHLAAIIMGHLLLNHVGNHRRRSRIRRSLSLVSGLWVFGLVAVVVWAV